MKEKSKETLLEKECFIITRYLVNENPQKELVQRYIAANRQLLATDVSREDSEIILFIHRHTWSIPFLDAFLGLARPTALLRNKILIMVAVLETTPRYVHSFVSEPLSAFKTILRLLYLGVSSTTKACIGTLIYPFISII